MLNFELLPVPWDHRLGFGIEFEFALAVLPYGSPDPHPEPRWFRQIYSIDVPSYAPQTDPATLSFIERQLNVELHIARTLTRAGFRAVSEMQYQRDIPACVLLKEPDPPDILWIVKHEPSIQFPTGQEEMYNWYGIEICTPALMYSPWNVRLIHKFCRIMRDTYRMNRNESCGLHIHVSLGKQTWNVEILQNLMALIFTFEPQLQTIHPEHRFEARNTATYPLREYANINMNFAPGENFSTWDRNWKAARMLERRRAGLPTLPPPARLVRDSLSAIFETRTRAELVSLFRTDDPSVRLGYNLSFLSDPYPDPFKRTIEFRQHTASMKADNIERWLAICCRLVDVARQVAGSCMEEKVKFRAFLEEHIEDEIEDFGLSFLLLNLGLMSEADYFHMKRAIMPDMRPERSLYSSSERDEVDGIV